MSEEDRQQKRQGLIEYSGLGLQLAVTITLCVLGGLWLDERCGTTPLFVLVGSFGALAAVFYQLYRVAQRSP